MPALHQGYTVALHKVDQGAAGMTTIAAAVSGTYIYIVTINVGMVSAGTIAFGETATPTLTTGAIPIAANGGFIMKGSTDEPVLWTTQAGVQMNYTTTAAAAKGFITYFYSEQKP